MLYIQRAFMKGATDICDSLCHCFRCGSEGTTLGAAYHTCATRIKDAADKFTQKALANLVMPDGRQIRFTPKARKSIPEDTLAEIR
jgi:hypothetical protein